MKFIDNYLKTQNATQSAKDAGYTGNCRQMGYSNLQKPYIKAEIDRRRQGYVAKIEARADVTNIATIEEALKFQSGIMRDEKIDKVLRLKASELIVKAYGGYTNAINVDPDEEIVQIIDDIQEDLLELEIIEEEETDTTE